MGETGILLGILAALGVGAVALVASSSSSSTPAAAPATSSCGGPLPPGYTWQLATSIVHGDHVRLTMSADDFDTVAASMPNLGSGITGWTNLLAQPQVAQVLGSSNVCAWAPGNALPIDWPADDVDVATEYHAEFVYQGQVAIAPSTMPIPVTAWKATPTTITGSSGSTATTNKGQNLQIAPASTSPQVVHLVPPASGVQAASVANTLPGTPLTLTIDGGGTFTGITSSTFVPGGTGDTDIAGNPVGVANTQPVPLPSGSVLTWTTPAAAGELGITWTDVAGIPRGAVLKYG